jgi:hypothetical protein
MKLRSEVGFEITNRIATMFYEHNGNWYNADYITSIQRFKDDKLKITFTETSGLKDIIESHEFIHEYLLRPINNKIITAPPNWKIIHLLKKEMSINYTR